MNEDFNSLLNEINNFVWAEEDVFLCEVISRFYGPEYLDVDKCALLVKREKIYFIQSEFDDLKKYCYRLKKNSREILGWIRFSTINKKIAVDKCIRDIPLIVGLKDKI